MVLAVLVLAAGFMSLILGLRAFSASGLPITEKKNLTGPAARVLGAFLLLFGILIVGGAVAIAVMANMRK